jgi:hypothetical protein
VNAFVIIIDIAFAKITYPASLKGQDLNQVLAQYTANNQWHITHTAASGEGRSIAIFLQQTAPASS